MWFVLTVHPLLQVQTLPPFVLHVGLINSRTHLRWPSIFTCRLMKSDLVTAAFGMCVSIYFFFFFFSRGVKRAALTGNWVSVSVLQGLTGTAESYKCCSSAAWDSADVTLFPPMYKHTLEGQTQTRLRAQVGQSRQQWSAAKFETTLWVTVKDNPGDNSVFLNMV